MTLGNHLMNQYTRSNGTVQLVTALATFYSPLLKMEINPLTQIVCSAGANGALFTAIQTFINPGEEVIIIEPFYTNYAPRVRFAGGIPKYISLRPEGKENTSADWKLDFTELENIISKKTKAIIFNNPNNPLGKVWTSSELGFKCNLIYLN